ncbi:MAG TPA: hypothetical protein VF070_17245 [Streptosporangiaceae bacterium]
MRAIWPSSRRAIRLETGQADPSLVVLNTQSVHAEASVPAART